MEHDKLITHWQNKVLALCWIAFACSYLLRTNFSIAIPGMMKSFGWSNASTGLIGSVLFWSYAVGQLVNGFIGDKLNSKAMVFIGIAVAALMNIFVGFSSNYIAVMIFWGVNGFFLSALWGPIVKTTALWFPEKKRTHVAVVLALTMTGGYVASWGIGGQLSSIFSWRANFIVPAVFSAVFAVIWLFAIRTDPHQVGLEIYDEANNSVEKKNIVPVEHKTTREVFVESRIWYIAIACMAMGFVREGILLWAPTFLMQAHGMSAAESSAFSLSIPVISTVGILLSGWFDRMMSGRNRLAATIFFVFASASNICVLLFSHSGTAIVIAALGLTVAFMYGADTILLTIVPYTFSKYNKASTVAGTLDFCAYIGAAFAGVAIGAVIDFAGWNSVILIWVLVSAAGMVSMMLSSMSEKREKTALEAK